MIRIQLPATKAATPVVTPTQQLPQLLTLREVATALRMSRSTLLAMVQDGSMPSPIRLSKRKTVFRVSDVVSRLA